MQDIEPFYNWEKHYVANEDKKSPFFGREHNLNYYEHDVYGYYIHPLWDEIGSETLYVKVLYADYAQHYVVIELMGEWNDAIHNDIMYLKRNVVDGFVALGINQFILIGENVMDYHGAEDDYYAEWFEDIEDGWIAAISFRDHVEREWQRFRLDYYLNFGGTLQLDNWRTLQPIAFYELVKGLMVRRLA